VAISITSVCKFFSPGNKFATSLDSKYGNASPSDPPDSGSSTTGSKHPITTPAPSPPPLVAPPPKPDRPLSRDEVRELQTLLKKKGFNAGTPDGVVGPKTRAAAQAFSSARQMKDAPGDPTLRVLEVARGH